MLWAVVTHLVGLVVDLLVGVRRAEHAQALEIALLRHQVLCWPFSPSAPRSWHSRIWTASESPRTE
jgi:hypothetical protein